MARLEGRSLKHAKTDVGRIESQELREAVLNILNSSKFPINVRRRMLQEIYSSDTVRREEKIIEVNKQKVSIETLRSLKDIKLNVLIPITIEVLEELDRPTTAITFETLRELYTRNFSIRKKDLAGNIGKARMTALLVICGYHFRTTTRNGMHLRALRAIRGTELLSVDERIDWAWKTAEKLLKGKPKTSKVEIPEGLI